MTETTPPTEAFDTACAGVPADRPKPETLRLRAQRLRQRAKTLRRTARYSDDRSARRRHERTANALLAEAVRIEGEAHLIEDGIDEAL